MNKVKKTVPLLAIVLSCWLTLAGCANIFAEPQEFPAPLITKIGTESHLEVEFASNMTFPKNKTAPIYKMVAEQDSILRESVSQAVGVDLSSLTAFFDNNEGCSYYNLITEDGYIRVIIDEAVGFWQYYSKTSLENMEHNEYISQMLRAEASLPTEAQAIEIARDYIRQNELYDGDLGDIGIGYTTTGSEFDENGEIMIERQVVFYPDIGGYNVYGLFKIAVTIGANGEIIGVIKQVNPVEAVGTVTLKTQAEIIKEVKTNSSSVSASAVDLKNAVITECRLAYYVDAYAHNGTAYAYPVYIMLGQGVFADDAARRQSEESFDIIVDAVKR